MVNYKAFETTSNSTYNVLSALRCCKENNEDCLIFDKGTYIFDDTYATEKAMCVSNHGESGYRKSAFYLEGFENFVIDGGGSTFVFTSVMNAFALIGCKNIVLKNFTVEFPNYPYPCGFIKDINKDEGYFDIFFDHPEDVIIQNNTFYVNNGEFCDRVHCDIRFKGDTKEVVYGTGDNSLVTNINLLNKEQLDRNTFRIYSSVLPEKTDVIGLLTGLRRASGFFVDECENTTIKDITLYSCIGIGVMAQMSHNITIDNYKTTPKPKKYISSAADATHFVGCTGTVTVKNSLFENMFDDALNVHGIYTKIISSNKNKATVRFMNEASIGIPIFRAGDVLNELDPETLKPVNTVTVKDAYMINRHMTELVFENEAELKESNLIENITRYPALVVDNCVIRNNRARGMLIATNKEAVVKNCNFHTSGSAIVLECDGKFWFESGAVSSLVIENNVFDNCRYANWDRGIISLPSNKGTEEGYYYHGKVQIINNVFKGNNDDDVYAENLNELVYENNTSDNPVLSLSHVKTVKAQKDAKILNI